jgi:hypothetical protein
VQIAALGNYVLRIKPALSSLGFQKMHLHEFFQMAGDAFSKPGIIIRHIIAGFIEKLIAKSF